MPIHASVFLNKTAIAMYKSQIKMTFIILKDKTKKKLKLEDI